MSKCKLALNAILVLLLFLPFAHAEQCAAIP